MLNAETTTQSSSVRQSLIQEIEQTSDYVLGEVLDFLLFVRARHSQLQAKMEVDDFEAIEDYDEPKEKILEDLCLSLQDAKAGRVHDISELWIGIDV
ncbi:hypothetical protein V2H45_20675 [Tumidithrix elongata RA019]|uniref:DUF2281 domain-containing protein n=1 Tax=Tumidithrix elongata BACA0141 TaxID=2716417 RepID=A0AAW9Q4T5_9CYAN|nr:hypothetical protein [Tumidithrix elongata RA019]